GDPYGIPLGFFGRRALTLLFLLLIFGEHVESTDGFRRFCTHGRGSSRSTATHSACQAWPRLCSESTADQNCMATDARTSHTVTKTGRTDAVVHAWDHGVPIEPDVWKQVGNLASVPGVERIALMPDAHIGK